MIQTVQREENWRELFHVMVDAVWASEIGLAWEKKKETSAIHVFLKIVQFIK